MGKMRFPQNLKKILLILIVVLIGGDVTLLFAASPSSAPAANNNSTSQLQQLQAQVQQQIQAMQQQQQSSTPAPTNSSNPLLAASNTSADNSGANPSTQNVQQMAAQLANSINNKTSGQDVANPVANAPVQSQLQSALAQAAAAKNSLANSAANSAAGIPTAGSVGMDAAMSNATNGGGSIATNASDINETAFNAMVQNTLPMSPEQIQKLRSVYLASQFAASSSPATPPRPTATSEFVDLSPGSTPPVIRLSQGFVTSLVFIDSTGAPWPIESYDVGNPSAFNIQWNKKGNTLMVQSTVLYNYGNLAVKLKGLDTPVMITLIPGQKVVDYRVDLRVPGLGPDAKPLPTESLPQGSSTKLLNVLDGIAPSDSKPLKVEGGDCQAWLVNDTLFVRTRLHVISPGWKATLSSADGMHAYEMQPTPMILVSQNGQMVQLKVKGL